MRAHLEPVGRACIDEARRVPPNWDDYGYQWCFADENPTCVDDGNGAIIARSLRQTAISAPASRITRRACPDLLAGVEPWARAIDRARREL